jgi:alpha-tubulin suppressor-like RCC1 family protein
LIVIATSPDDIVATAAGSVHMLLLSRSGKVFGFGYNGKGQIAQSNTYAAYPTPTEIIIPNNGKKIVAIAAGSEHSVAVDEAGSVFTWGSGSNGRLGVSSLTAIVVTTPTAIIIPNNKTIVYVACGLTYTLLIDSTGGVYGFGGNGGALFVVYDILSPTNTYM